MISQAQLYQWKSQLAYAFPHLSKWQVLGLAIFSIGVILSERCTLTKVAEYLPMFGKPDSVERRLQRWISNPRLDIQVCLKCWITWVLAGLDSTRPIVLVDETKLGNSLGIMMVGLAYRGRCIPLLWCCYAPKAYPPEGQVAIIHQLLKQLHEHIPSHWRPLIQADRGIGTSPQLMRGVQALGWRYLFRVQNHSKVKTSTGIWRTVGHMVQEGQTWRGKGIAFRRRGQVDAFVQVIWRWGEKEAWCLVTNDPLLRGEHYALRNWQEQSFRDLKRGGWHWDRSQVWKPTHAERLLLVLAVAYAWVLTQGTLLLATDIQTQRAITRGKRTRFSIFRRGLRYLRQNLYHKLTVYPGLFFAPDQLLC